jgi:hypothetical protein
MGKIIFAFALTLSWCQVSLSDELDDAYQACLSHKNDIAPRVITRADGTRIVDASAAHRPLFDAPWEHCLVIHRAWLQRNAAPVATPPQSASPTPSDPAYQSTVDLAKKLTTPEPHQ